MRWSLIVLAIAAAICIAVYLITGLGWEIGEPLYNSACWCLLVAGLA